MSTVPAFPGEPVPPHPAHALPEGYSLHMAAPSAPEYVRLRAETGLTPVSEEQAAGAIHSPGTWAFRTVRERGSGVAVGMGRVVSDGSWYFVIADIAVLEGHRRQGIARAVVQSLLADIEDRAHPHPYVTLTADPKGRALYESLGFRDAGERGAAGMELWLGGARG